MIGTPQEAASALASGELAILPTETVYGLAADGLNADAVRKIFAVKGRPTSHPVILHMLDWNQSLAFVVDPPAQAAALAQTFWPGPITLVLRKTKEVPSEVTAGQLTVAVRAPCHPAFREVLKILNRPIAAPSANRFMGISPTRVEDVDAALMQEVAVAVDGGPCTVGIESTIVDCTSHPARILRPGMISRNQIEALIGQVTSARSETRAPGSYPKHYAPQAEVILTAEVPDDATGIAMQGPTTGSRWVLSSDPTAYAANLYHALAQLDLMGVDRILIQKPPDTAEWEAVLDRLLRACGRGKDLNQP